MDTMDLGSAADVRHQLSEYGYLPDEHIAGTVHLAAALGKPVLVEGPAGTGKTELAKSVAAITDARLIRLQCYEGLDESRALYEWDYRRQLLAIQAGRSATMPAPSMPEYSTRSFYSLVHYSRPFEPRTG